MELLHSAGYFASLLLKSDATSNVIFVVLGVLFLHLLNAVSVENFPCPIGTNLELVRLVSLLLQIEVVIFLYLFQECFLHPAEFLIPLEQFLQRCSAVPIPFCHMSPHLLFLILGLRLVTRRLWVLVDVLLVFLWMSFPRFREICILLP